MHFFGLLGELFKVIVRFCDAQITPATGQFYFTFFFKGRK